MRRFTVRNCIAVPEGTLPRDQVLPAYGTTEVPHWKTKQLCKSKMGSVCLFILQTVTYLLQSKPSARGWERKEMSMELENQWYLALLSLHFSRDVQKNFVNDFSVKEHQGKETDQPLRLKWKQFPV